MSKIGIKLSTYLKNTCPNTLSDNALSEAMKMNVLECLGEIIYDDDCGRSFSIHIPGSVKYFIDESGMYDYIRYRSIDYNTAGFYSKPLTDAAFDGINYPSCLSTYMNRIKIGDRLSDRIGLIYEMFTSTTKIS